MGYLHIDNLYKIPDFLLRHDRLYALEKIHGTSAHIKWDGNALTFFSGGVKHDEFVALFDERALTDRFSAWNALTVYGEAYGGKCQKMSGTYGPALKFVAFDVQVHVQTSAGWLTVPEAAAVAARLGFDFVHYAEVPSTLDAVNAARDRPSVQAKKNGILEDKISEGVVLRPLAEMRDHRGSRVIAKHKRAEFMETKTPREVNPDKVKVLTDAKAVADEWVTDMRLTHVLDKLPGVGVERTCDVIRAMLEDVKREGEGEIVWTSETNKSIGRATADMFKRRLYAGVS